VKSIEIAKENKMLHSATSSEKKIKLQK